MTNFAPRILISIIASCFAIATTSAQPDAPRPDRPDFSKPHSDIPVHDPVMAKKGENYCFFCTGMGIGVWTSPDLKEWVCLESVSSEPPAWAVDAVPTFR